MLHIKEQHRPKFKIIGPLESPTDPVLAIRNSYSVISDDFAFCLCLVFGSSYLYLEGPAKGQLWNLGKNKHEDYFYEIETDGAYISTCEGGPDSSGVLLASVGVLPIGANDGLPIAAT